MPQGEAKPDANNTSRAGTLPGGGAGGAVRSIASGAPGAGGTGGAGEGAAPLSLLPQPIKLAAATASAAHPNKVLL
jgi:hypothetical protein